MPILSVSWAKIKEKYADDTALVALTTRHISLLSALSEQLKWSKTFRTDDLDTDDLEEIQTEVDDLIANLTMPVMLADIIGYIDEIEGLLKALNNTANCCGDIDMTGGQQYTDDTVDYVGDVPQNIVDAGYADDTDDWDGFYDYKCMISHVMIDDMESGLRQIHEQFDNTGVILGGVGTVAAIIGTVLAFFATGGISLILEVIAVVGAASAVWGGLTELGDEEVENLADKVATYHDSLACAIYYADGIQGAVDELKAAIDTYFTATEAIILKNMNLEPKLRGLYSGRYDQQDVAQAMADNGYDPLDYDCSCALSAGYHWLPANDITYTLDPDTYGRVNSATVSGPYITFGTTVANSASWGCATYPTTLANIKVSNHVYQTLAVRFTVLENTGNSSGVPPGFAGSCIADLNDRLIWFYTLDAANGIDATWADNESEHYAVEAGGTARRAVDYVWTSGQVSAVHTTPGTTGVHIKYKVEMLVWVPT